MKKTFFVLVLLCGFVFVARWAMAEESEDVATLKVAHRSYLATLGAFDATKMAEHVPDKFLFMPNKEIWPVFFTSNKQVEATFTKVLANRIRFDVTSPQAAYVVVGDTGIISGIGRFNSAKWRDGKFVKGIRYGRFTDVWTKVNGEWKMIVSDAQYLFGPTGPLPRK